ncbi:MAG: DUF1292 domain-containing protein [Clostridia bacterium]|nr:DUF1292 domain-containing protein [Clostridia bacterium]
MSEENKTPNAEEEIEIVTLVDENNEEHEFELIGGLNDKGQQYFALIPAGSADEDGGFEEYIILKQILNDDGTEDLVEIEDDAEFDRIAQKFDDAFNSETDYDA